VTDASSMPYWQTAQTYFDAGWSPVPLPYKEKSPVPDNVTGSTAPYVTAEQVARWLGRKRPGSTFKGRPELARAGNLSFMPGNIALRMPPDVLGIDVDLYGGKAGAETLADAEKRWGALPPTWASTSRTDGSGIRLYRVPEGLKWRDVGPGIETIKWYHRYVIVMPSVHDKTNKRYIWVRPDGQRVTDEFPAVDELPMLPAQWVAGLTDGQEYSGSGDAGDIDYNSAKAWLEANGAGEMCATMHGTLTKYTREVRGAGEAGGAHDKARDGAWALLGDAGLGHAGAEDAIRQLGAVFLTAVAGRRDGQGEWRRIVIKGVGKVREEMRRGNGGDGAVTETDPCDMFSDVPAQPAKANAGSSAFDWERDDIGNAQRLANAVGTDARWVDSWQTWVVYDMATATWNRIQGNSLMMRQAISVVRKMGTEAAYIEDPESLKAFKSWVKTSGGLPRLAAMQTIARNLGGLGARAEEFDADWGVLHALNGALVLGPNGVAFRPRVHGDMATLCAPVAYDAKAKSALWERFLREVLPDAETRQWVQKLVGASLVGGNPDRSMVIGIGPTTSGKSTFVEVLATAIGGYAATYNLQMFREKRDEGPRVDLLSALPKRFLYTVEASSDVVLHVDSIKRMTGGDRLTARGMASNVYVEAVPAFTPWLMCNEPPSVPGADAALRRRLKVAPFVVSLDPDRIDTTLRAKLSDQSQLPGILAWAVEGWNLYQSEGLDGPGMEVMETTFEVRESLSLMDAWMRQTCEFGAEYCERTEELHTSYLTWLELNREEDKRHSSLSAFGRAMSSNNYRKERRYIDGSQTIVRIGLRLRKLATKG